MESLVRPTVLSWWQVGRVATLGSCLASRILATTSSVLAHLVVHDKDHGQVARIREWVALTSSAHIHFL